MGNFLCIVHGANNFRVKHVNLRGASSFSIIIFYPSYSKKIKLVTSTLV